MMEKFVKLPLTNKHFRDLNPTDAGRFTPEPERIQTRCVDKYYMYLIKKGEFHIIIDSIEYIYHSGELIVIPPNTKYTWFPGKGESLSFEWIGFDGALGERFLTMAPPNAKKYDGSIFDDMLEINNISTTREEYIAAILFRLLSELDDRRLPPSHDYVNMAKDYIQIQYNFNNISIKELADAIGINKRYLARIFKKQEGITPMEYLTNVRMTHAAEFLQRGYSVTEVSRMCGYSSPYYFSNKFSERFSVSPSKYRKYVHSKK